MKSYVVGFSPNWDISNRFEAHRVFIGNDALKRAQDYVNKRLDKWVNGNFNITEIETEID